MQKISSLITVKNNLKENFTRASNNEIFLKLTKNLKIEDEKLYKHTSQIEESVKEFENCMACKNLQTCKNELKGYCKLPEVDNEDISFTYKACKYKNKELEKNKYKKNLDLFEMPKTLKEAKMKDIYTDDKSRIEVIKYIDSYYRKFNKENQKGLYLHGNFGSGKTYLIAALFNELAKKEIKSAIIYFPEFLRTLKSSFEKSSEEISSSDKYEYIKKVPLLLIDDIGAENVTPWGRDEILGTLLQYRMNENLPTFFTSNLTIEELESHLSVTSKKEDKVKARRIIERIKSLTVSLELIGKSRR